MIDAHFIGDLVKITMRTYVEKIWGTFSDEYNRKIIAEAIERKTYSIIELNGQDVGAIAVERQPTHIELAQLYILPSHQNQGIGTELIRNLARESRDARKPLRLRVLVTNPAKRLYEREGFYVTSVTPERFYMELGT